MLPPKTSEGVTNWVTAGMAVATHGNTKQAWHTISVYQLLICFPIFKAVKATGFKLPILSCSFLTSLSRPGCC